MGFVDYILFFFKKYFFSKIKIVCIPSECQTVPYLGQNCLQRLSTEKQSLSPEG